MTSFFKINTLGTLWGVNFKGNKDGSMDLRQIDVSLAKMGLFRISKEFQFRVCNLFFFFTYFLFIFLLKYNWFTEFCCFLSNLNMNQP